MSLPPHRRVLAPMVGGSELPFRLLCRRYGADLCYTPMMHASLFATDAEYRAREFTTCPQDRPLVAHFCGNTAEALVAAGLAVQPHVDAVDLNLGCPQRIAHSGHFGSYLLGEEDRETVLNIVRSMAAALRVPVFCKIRLLDSAEETVRLCRQLVDAGAALIAVHARHRGTATRRRDGPAKLDQVAAIKRALGGAVPILSNGNIREPADVAANLQLTSADGVMSAEGLLDRPTLFAEAATAISPEALVKLKRRLKRAKALRKAAKRGQPLGEREQRRVAKIGKLKRRVAAGSIPTPLEVAAEYLELCAQHPAPVSNMVFHVRRMCKAELERYQLLEATHAAQSRQDLEGIVARCREFAEGRAAFVHDPGAEAAARERAEARRAERGKRQAYEGRMLRKARREGKPDDFYLKMGLAPPTRADLAAVVALPEPERIGWWRARFGQHCLAHHTVAEGCARGRNCAFLHAEIGVAQPPSWLEEAAG